MSFSIDQLSPQYAARRLNAADVDAIYQLYQGNPLYFMHMKSSPSATRILEDLTALPPGKSSSDKFFVGFYQGGTLTAILDLVLAYPRPDIAYIGLFMLAQRIQGHGAGSALLADVLTLLRAQGFCFARLGYVKTNPQSAAFWLKNGFQPTGDIVSAGDYDIVVMQRSLQPPSNLTN